MISHGLIRFASLVVVGGLLSASPAKATDEGPPTCLAGGPGSTGCGYGNVVTGSCSIPAGSCASPRYACCGIGGILFQTFCLCYPAD